MALFLAVTGSMISLAGTAASGVTLSAASAPPTAPYAQFTAPDGHWVDSVAFSPNGKTVAVASINETFSSTGVTYKGGHTYLWNVSSASAATRQEHTTLSDPGGKGVLHAVFSPDAKYLAVADADGAVYVWNVASRKLLDRLADPGSAGLTSVTFGPGDAVITSDGNGSAFLWELSGSGSPAATFTPKQGEGLYTLAVSPNGSKLALGGSDGDAYLYDIATRTLIATLADPHSKGVSSLAFGGHNGVILAAGDNTGQTYLWNLTSHTLLGPLRSGAITQAVRAVAFSPAGNILITGDGYGLVYVWNVATRTLLASLQYPGERGLLSAAFSPKGTTIAAGDITGRANLWAASWLPR